MSEEFRSLNMPDAFEYLSKRVGQGPLQNYHDITFAMAVMKSYIPNVKCILEIGSYLGANAAVMSKMLPDNGIVICIEPNDEMNDELISDIIAPVRLIRLKGYSNDPDMYEKLVEALGGNVVDVLFIDGDHSYEMAKHDYLKYSPRVSGPGIVAFHDIRLYHTRAYMDGVEGVGYYWDVIKKNGCYTEICAGAYVNQFGIGLSFR